MVFSCLTKCIRLLPTSFLPDEKSGQAVVAMTFFIEIMVKEGSLPPSFTIHSLKNAPSLVGGTTKQTVVYRPYF